MSFGPTGKFPRGQLAADDEGELTIGITHKDKTVIIKFGTSITWFGTDADGALELAQLLTFHAKAIKNEIS